MKIDTAKVLAYWHLAGIIVAGVGGAATQIQPFTAAYPKVGAIVAGIGLASLGVSSWMSRIANDKVVRSLINDPTSPTPQGFGIPTPDPVGTPATVAAVVAGDAATIKAVQDSAIVNNVVEHANAVAAAAPEK
jgi:hypothetical protein